MHIRQWSKPIVRWLTGVLTTTVVGSILQTQCTLAALTSLGQDIDFATRLSTTGKDLVGFGPAFAGIVACGFLIALPLAAWLMRRWPRHRWLAPLAGATAILVALLLMRQFLGLTAIAAAREPLGVVGLALAGALGGWVALRRG
jgi:hypothetical protein